MPSTEPRLLHKLEGAPWEIEPYLRAGGYEHWGQCVMEVGSEKCPGTMLFALSGAVNKPGIYEMPMGAPLRRLIEEFGGGVPRGRKVKAVFPGGPSFAMVTADQLDLPMDFESLKKAGTGLGSAGVIVVDDATCMVAQTLHFSNFFMVESCGPGPPFRLVAVNLGSPIRT